MSPKAPIYLCTMEELAGPGASDERIDQRMQLLSDILRKLGWSLGSGVSPNFHELWALKPESPALGDNGGHGA